MKPETIKSTASSISIGGYQLWLIPEKAVFIEEENAILIADLHLGKTGHFRRAGIPIPTEINDKNLESLISLIQRTNPQKVIFLGDLFHSSYNDEWESLGQVINHFASCEFHLVRGNHDILSLQQYKRYNIGVSDQLILGNILLTHEPLEKVPEGYYNISGHVHPGARLIGRARQSMILPCFYFEESKGLLPAFGTFTGLARINVAHGSKVFLIANGKVIEMQDD